MSKTARVAIVFSLLLLIVMVGLVASLVSRVPVLSSAAPPSIALEPSQPPAIDFEFPVPMATVTEENYWLATSDHWSEIERYVIDLVEIHYEWDDTREFLYEISRVHAKEGVDPEMIYTVRVYPLVGRDNDGTPLAHGFKTLWVSVQDDRVHEFDDYSYKHMADVMRVVVSNDEPTTDP
ncbi:MAG: hypothetical protein AAGK09_12585 [Planctomycetota bacterium]